MPIATSMKGMLNSLKKQYPGGKTACYDMADGTKHCMGQKAWSVFYAYMKKHGKDETKGLNMDEELPLITPDLVPEKLSAVDMSDEELIYEHARAHSEFCKIGDQPCKDHFVIANEMIDRGMPHAKRSKCDIVVGLSRKMDEDEEGMKADPDEELKTKWKACKAMMLRLNTGIPFTTGVFKDVDIDGQKKMVKNLARTVRRAMASRGWRPVAKKKKSGKGGCG